MKTGRLLGIIVASALLGFGVGNKFPTLLTPQSETPVENTSPINSNKPLSVLTSVETPKGRIYLLVYQDYVYFNPFESAVNNDHLITIKKSEYPIFEQREDTFNTVWVDSKEDSGNFYVKLSNNIPDHGGYKNMYSLLVNPFTGEIKETKD